MLSAGSKPVSKRALSSAKILLEAPFGVGGRGVFDGEAHHRRLYQPLDVRHGCNEHRPLAAAQRLQKTRGQHLRSLVELRSFGEPRAGEIGAFHPAIVCTHANQDQSGARNPAERLLERVVRSRLIQCPEQGVGVNNTTK
jgi:hypothetical protein